MLKSNASRNMLWINLAIHLLTIISLQTEAVAEEIQWHRTLPGRGDGAWSVAVDDDSVIMLSSDGSRIFKVDQLGNTVWATRGLGRGANGFALAVHSSGIYLAGRTTIALPGQEAFGLADGFVASYDHSGQQQWVRQFGTPNGEAVFGIAVAVHGVYVTGGQAIPYFFETPSIGFVRKLDFSGNIKWVQNFDDGGRGVYGFSVASSQNGVFVAGTENYGRSTFVRRFDTQGTELWSRNFHGSRPGYFQIARSITVNESGNQVYVGGIFDARSFGNTSLGNWQSTDDAKSFLLKTDGNGNELWRRTPTQEASSQIYGVTTSDHAVFVTGFVDIMDNGGNEAAESAFCAKYNHAGDREWTRRIGNDTFTQGKAISERNGSIYIAGLAAHVESPGIREVESLLVKVSDSPSISDYSKLEIIGDINGDGKTEVIVFIDSILQRLLVYDVTSGELLNQVLPVDQSNIIDLTTLPDVTENGASEVVVLSRYPVHFATYDTLTSDLINHSVFGTGAFDSQSRVIGIITLNDRTRNNVSEVAILEEYGWLRAAMRDPVYGVASPPVHFNPYFRGAKLLSLPDINDNGYPDVGLLSLDSPWVSSDKIEIRDGATESNSKLLGQIWLGDKFDSLDAIAIAPHAKSMVPQVAVLRQQIATHNINVLVVDIASGRWQRQIGMNPNYQPLKLIQINDMNLNGISEIGVLGVHRDTGQIRVEIHDSGTGVYIRSVYFGRGFVPSDILSIDDISGNGVDELILLARRFNGDSRRIMIRDAMTNRSIRHIDIASNFH